MCKDPNVCLLLLFFFAWFDRFPTLLIINVPLLEVNPETLLKPRMSVLKAEYAGGH